ncbi:MerR family transcriptional regulator [Paraburkholderia sp. J8-2]|uniref:MerR family transcriptional regulator n=1 Tax=Paraburkholderia sp. J8-2 TaxID=2805440 RepID=UPI002AB73570|nr:hypothetical protein [Paraburkholderia sp. J8-2]
MNRHQHAQGYSLRDLQSLLGVSRRVLTGLIDAGFVSPVRGPRNEMRFSFREVSLLRTAFELQSAGIPSRRILDALNRIRYTDPEGTPLTSMRIVAVGGAVAVREGNALWDASSDQQLFDFTDPPQSSTIASMQSAPTSVNSRRRQAADWYALAEELQDTDGVGAEDAYRKALEVAPEPHYMAYANLGALISRDHARSADALAVFDKALTHFNGAELLHYNRAVLLELLNRVDDAAASYLKCLEINARNEDAICAHASILEDKGRLDDAAKAYIDCLKINPGHDEALQRLRSLMDKLEDDTQAVIRHLSAWRRINIRACP